MRRKFPQILLPNKPMKKHWQIKPWIVITILVILVGSILFAVGISQLGGMSSQSAGDYSMGTKALAPTMNESFRIAEDSASSTAYSTSAQTPAQDRMIIKTGSLSMVVGNVVDTAKAITDYAEKNGGFIVNTSVDKSNLELFGSVTIRVPSKTFNETIAYVKTIGEVQSENISGQDITEEYTDLDGQLKNLKATEEQFTAIMKDAYKIEDVLAVQRELMNVRSQIESMEGRMKYLRESVDMSSLTVYLSTDPTKLPIVDEGDQWKPLAILKNAFRSLLSTGETIVNGVIWLVVFIPVIAVLGVIVWVARRLVRKLLKKKK